MKIQRPLFKRVEQGQQLSFSRNSLKTLLALAVLLGAILPTQTASNSLCFNPNHDATTSNYLWGGYHIPANLGRWLGMQPIKSTRETSLYQDIQTAINNAKALENAIENNQTKEYICKDFINNPLAYSLLLSNEKWIHMLSKKEACKFFLQLKIAEFVPFKFLGKGVSKVVFSNDENYIFYSHNGSTYLFMPLSIQTNLIGKGYPVVVYDHNTKIMTYNAPEQKVYVYNVKDGSVYDSYQNNKAPQLSPSKQTCYLQKAKGVNLVNIKIPKKYYTNFQEIYKKVTKNSQQVPLFSLSSGGHYVSTLTKGNNTCAIYDLRNKPEKAIKIFPNSSGGVWSSKSNYFKQTADNGTVAIYTADQLNKPLFYLQPDEEYSVSFNGLYFIKITTNNNFRNNKNYRIYRKNNPKKCIFTLENYHGMRLSYTTQYLTACKVGKDNKMYLYIYRVQKDAVSFLRTLGEDFLFFTYDDQFLITKNRSKVLTIHQLGEKVNFYDHLCKNAKVTSSPSSRYLVATCKQGTLLYRANYITREPCQNPHFSKTSIDYIVTYWSKEALQKHKNKYLYGYKVDNIGTFHHIITICKRYILR